MENINLSEVAFFQEGPGVRKWQFRTEGIKLLNVGNIVDGQIDLSNTERHLDEKEVKEKYFHFLADENDIVMASSGATWGKTAFIKKEHLPVCLNTSTIRFKPNNERNLNREFLFWFLNSSIFKNQIDRLITGSAQPNFGSSHLKQVKIPLPDIKTQQKIASILEQADSAKQKRKQASQLTERFLQSSFIEMFGDPVRNEKGWEVKKLKEISTKIHSGNTPKGGSAVYVEQGIIFFRSQNVWRNRFDFDDIAYIDAETHRKMMKSSLMCGDILMTKTGRFNTENSSLGRAALYMGDDNKANINGHVYLIRLQKHILRKFVLFILTTNEYRDYIRSVCVGGIDKRQLNKEHLENFPIINPPISLQQKFVALVEQVEKLREKQRASEMELENLFQALMQKYFEN